jgi:hypothetical protein
MKIIDGLIYTDARGGTDGSKITPMPHPKLQDHYRVPIYKQLIPIITYTIFVGNDTTRIYTEDTLPPFIQTKITIANATCDDIADDETVTTNVDLFLTGWSSLDEKYNTAWRASTSLYMVVMTKFELFNLKGITL